ncbi:MAG: AMP-binding protein [Propionibacteriaceae bacterium]|jgi:long-chain acyl-CoA synthetase|nr:AMP-binding protein [Propionibacteriaceae bacterium]
MLQKDWVKSYQPGVAADVEVPDESLVDLAERAVVAAGNLVATDFFGNTLSYRKLGERIARAAQGLHQLGVRRGDRVAIVLPNCPQHIVAYYAVLRLGAVVVEHNPLYTSRELRHMFEDHSARVAICWDKAVTKLQAMPRDIPLNTIISVNMVNAFSALKRLALKLPIPSLMEMRDKLTAKVRGTVPWEKVVAAPPLDARYPKPVAQDLAAIQYTSGTTAQPKGAMLTHRALYANSVQARQWLHGIGTGTEVTYGVLPLFHVFGMTLVTVLGVLTQSRMVLFPNFDVSMVLDAAKRIPPTVFGAVPPIFQAVATGAQARKISLRSAKYCISGAMGLPNATAELWESLAGGPLIEGYGMTEAAPVIAGNPDYEGRKLGTVGLPFPSTIVKVVDPDNPDIEVPLGSPGELLVAGPQVFSGYWNNPAETEYALLPDNWLRTGDVVVQDEEGFLTVVDRVKDLILTNGFNVSPTEVESVLRGHPDIEDVTVVGLPDESAGETVVAAVVMHPGARIDETAMRTWAKGRLAAYKVPRSFIEVAELPKSMLGKALRNKVRSLIS